MFDDLVTPVVVETENGEIVVKRSGERRCKIKRRLPLKMFLRGRRNGPFGFAFRARGTPLLAV
jgi:hypothetical protein